MARRLRCKTDHQPIEQAHKTLRGRSGAGCRVRPLLLSVLLILPLGVGALAVAGEWEAPAWADTLTNPVHLDSTWAAQTAALYQKNCSVCHGATGKGDGMMSHGMQPPPANFNEAAGINEDSDGSLFWKISNGKKPMPPWKKELTPGQIWALVSHVRRFSQPPTPPDSLNEAQPDTTKP